MKWPIGFALGLLLTAACSVSSAASPYVGGHFQGRIAYSCDGNNRDRDDLFASAVTIAMFGAFNATDRVVHFDYNSILGEDDPEYLRIHEESVRGAAKRFGLPEAVIFNDSTQLAAAVDNIRDAVNASSATNPLHFIIAGPMEVPWRGIHAADPDKRQYVYCISHTVWNDLFFWNTSNPEITHNKRDLIELGVHWIQIANQQGLGTCPEPKHGPCLPEKWALWNWMRDSYQPHVAWLYERLQRMGRPDCSDSGMVHFLLCGNEQPGVEDLRQLLHGNVPAAITQRPTIRLEAENFFFDNYRLPQKRSGSGVSQRMFAERVPGAATGNVRTVFQELYAASGRYDVEVRYFAHKEGRSDFTLFVGGVPYGASWTATADAEGWKTKTIADVSVKLGDEIKVSVRASGKAMCGIDYVQLTYRPERSVGATFHGSAAVKEGCPWQAFEATDNVRRPQHLPPECRSLGLLLGQLVGSRFGERTDRRQPLRRGVTSSGGVETGDDGNVCRWAVVPGVRLPQTVDDEENCQAGRQGHGHVEEP